MGVRRVQRHLCSPLRESLGTEGQCHTHWGKHTVMWSGTILQPFP